MSRSENVNEFDEDDNLPLSVEVSSEGLNIAVATPKICRLLLNLLRRD